MRQTPSYGMREDSRLEPVEEINCLDIEQLINVERSMDTPLANTRRLQRVFRQQSPFRRARGMGKSSLSSAVHRTVVVERPVLWCWSKSIAKI